MPRPSDPTPDSWRAVKALFEQALDLPADEREAFIDAARCDSATRAELRSLLGHYATSSDADNSASTGRRGVLDAPARLAGLAAREGQRLGAWQIVRPLQALADASPQDAGSSMWLGELVALQAAAVPAERALWRRTAHDAYARSAALKPLVGVHLARWAQLDGG